MLRRLSLLVCLVSALLIGPLGSVAIAGIDYSGALTSFSADPGLLATGQWSARGIDTIGWDVSQNLDGSWHYVYALNVPVLDVHHFIIELPTSFTAADIMNPVGTFSSFSVGLFTPGATLPFLPGNIYGADFLTTQGNATQIAFDTIIAPNFGNSYAQGTETNSASNTGFLVTGNYAPANGSVDHKLLVPNPSMPVPDGSTIVLACFGLLQLLAVKNKVFRTGS